VCAWLGWTCAQRRQLDDAASYFRQGCEQCHEIGDICHESIHLHSLAAVALAQGNADAAAQHFREAENLGVPISFEVWSGLLALMSGDYSRAKSVGEAGLKRAVEIGYSGLKGDFLALAGVRACLDEDYLEGKRLCEATQLEQSKPFLKGLTLTDKWGQILADCGLGDYETARRHLAALPPDLPWAMIFSLAPHAIVLAHEGKSQRAVELLGLAFSYPPNMTGWMAQWPLLTRLRTKLEAELGMDRYAAAWAKGQTMTLEQAVAYAWNV
jgi:hypothetical protein